MGYAVGLGLVVGVGVIVGGVFECLSEGGTVNSTGVSSVRLDFSGVAAFYSRGAGLFLIAG